MEAIHEAQEPCGITQTAYDGDDFSPGELCCFGWGAGEAIDAVGTRGDEGVAEGFADVASGPEDEDVNHSGRFDLNKGGLSLGRGFDMK